MTGRRLFGQALRMALRDWRSGELRLLALALLIAVASVASVGFLADRVRQGLHRDAAQYLGGDAVLDSDRPIDSLWDASARDLGLRSARSVSFPSMVMAESSADANLLVAVKAVSDAYPLRGSLELQDGSARRTAQGAPESGTIWVDAAVLPALGIHVGERLRLGNSLFRASAVIASEPDRALQVLGFAPRVMINAGDLDATGLVQPASRVTYRWMVAGDAGPVAALVGTMRAQLARGQHLETLEDGRPEVQRTLNRAGRFLGLVALLTALIAAVAVHGAARRFCARRLDSCALMRCLGLTQGQILGMFAWEFAIVGIGASFAGVLAGLGLHFVLLELLKGLVQESAPLPTALPAIQALLCGVILLLGFGLPPLEQLRRVSPMRVLRRDVGDPSAGALLVTAAGAVGMSALLVWTAGDPRVGAIAGGGFLACIGAFALLARLLLRGLQLLRRSGSGGSGAALRIAAAALQRRPGASVAQLVALAVGLMALLVLAIVRTDLIDQWRRQAPVDAPNHFLINIQPDQAEAIGDVLRAAHVAGGELEPMVRGRLVAIDGVPIGPETYSDERARALIDREFNLSYRTDAPAHNTIVQGRWFTGGAPELSIEEGIAKRLDIRLGQKLRFDVAGQAVEAGVTSVRKVNWDSMRVNFFVILSPALLQDAPQSLITSFHLAPAQAGLIPELLRRFPNLTVIDTGQVLTQLRSMLDQVIAAAQFLFVFALAAGVLVLYTALLSSQDERMREAALLRALGASRRQLARAQTAEMVMIGILAGVLAAAGAAAVSWALARYVFDFDFAAPVWVAFAGIAGGVLAALAGGRAGLRRILLAPPLLSLRDA